jgi:succinoglycan biosynthesis protein ExoA
LKQPVIPTLNEARHIRELLARLSFDADSSGISRIVVADGGSTDDTCQLVLEAARKDERIALMHNPAKLQSVGINEAVRRYGADNDVLIRHDAHSVYPPGFCAGVLRSLEENGADSVVVTMDTLGYTPVQAAIALVSNSVLGNGGSRHRGGRKSGFVDHGHHAAFRLARFRGVGGYDESFSHNEDAELDCRQRALGARIYLDAGVRIGYVPRASLGALCRQYFFYGRGRSRTLRRHPGSIRARQLVVPSHIAACLACIGLAPLEPSLLGLPIAYLSALALFSIFGAFRMRSPAGLLSGPCALAMHCAWAFGLFHGLCTVRERPWTPAETLSIECDVQVPWPGVRQSSVRDLTDAARTDTGVRSVAG